LRSKMSQNMIIQHLKYHSIRKNNLLFDWFIKYCLLLDKRFI